MIDDISELTKDSLRRLRANDWSPWGRAAVGAQRKSQENQASFRGSALPCCYTRGEEESEEDSYEPRGKSGHHRVWW